MLLMMMMVAMEVVVVVVHEWLGMGMMDELDGITSSIGMRVRQITTAIHSVIVIFLFSAHDATSDHLLTAS